MKLKDFFNKTKNKNNKEISLHFKKKEAKFRGVDIDDILDMEIKADRDFLK